MSGHSSFVCHKCNKTFQIFNQIQTLCCVYCGSEFVEKLSNQPPAQNHNGKKGEKYYPYHVNNQPSSSNYPQIPQPYFYPQNANNYASNNSPYPYQYCVPPTYQKTDANNVHYQHNDSMPLAQKANNHASNNSPYPYQSNMVGYSYAYNQHQQYSMYYQPSNYYNNTYVPSQQQVPAMPSVNQRLNNPAHDNNSAPNKQQVSNVGYQNSHQNLPYKWPVANQNNSVNNRSSVPHSNVTSKVPQALSNPSTYPINYSASDKSYYSHPNNAAFPSIPDRKPQQNAVKMYHSSSFISLTDDLLYSSDSLPKVPTQYNLWKSDYYKSLLEGDKQFDLPQDNNNPNISKPVPLAPVYGPVSFPSVPITQNPSQSENRLPTINESQPLNDEASQTSESSIWNIWNNINLSRAINASWEGVEGVFDEVSYILAPNQRRIWRVKPPASDTAINQDCVMFKIEEKDVEQNPDCPICFEPWSVGNEAKLLPCKHFFHSNCVVKWLQTKNSCPICRFELPSSDHKYERYKRKEREKAERENRIH